MNVPKLRFPEFDGEWEETRLDSYGIFKSGVGFPEIEQGGKGGTPFFKVSDMNLAGNENVLTRANHYVTDEQVHRLKYKPIKKKSVVFAKVGAAVFLERKRIAQDFLIDNNMMAFTPNSKITIEYSAVLFRNTRLSKFAQVGALPSYNGSDLASIKVVVPSLPEQKKIAAFLGVVDAKIGALRARRDGLERYKRGLMQALFSQTLRFAKPDGTAFPEWEVMRLGDIATKNDSGIYKNRDLYGSGHNIVGVSDLFSMNAIDGQSFRQVPLDDAELAKNTLQEGDILYAESSLVRAGIAKAVYVTAQGAGTAFAWHTRRFSVDNHIANSVFIFYYLESEMARRYIESVATQTALTGITTKDYFKTPVFLPHPDEQQKIADALSAMDEKIAAVADQVTQMEAFKKGLLQQMFV